MFGPTGNENYSIELNKKVRKQALSSLLSKKLSEGELLLVDKLSIPDYKTKNAISFLKNLQLGNEKILLVLSHPEETTEYVKKSFGNLADVSITTSLQISILKLFSSRFIVFTEKAFKEVEEKLA